jgi:hypothetical protein
VRAWGLAAAAAVALVPTAATAADTTPTVTFAPTTRSFDWEHLEKDVAVEVTNETPGPVHLRFLVTPFRNANISFRKPLATVTPAERTVGAGDSTVVKLVVWSAPAKKKQTTKTADKAKGQLPPALVAERPDEPGSYSGSLVAYDPAGKAFARLALVLVVPGVPSGKAKPEPLVDSRAVTAHRCNLLQCRDGPAAGEVRIPLAKKLKANQQLALTTSKRLGVIKTGDDDVAVYWDGKPAEGNDAGTSSIGLRFSGFDAAGKYEGKLHLLPDDQKSGEVALAVTFTDSIWRALFWIGLGVLASFALTHLMGVSIPYRRLRRQIKMKRTEYDTSYQDFHKAAEGKPWVDYEVAPAIVAKIESDLVREANALRHSYVGNIPTDRLTTLSTKIETEFTTLMFLKTFTDELGDLEAKVSELSTLVPLPLVGLDLTPPPFAATKLRELFSGRPYDDLAELGKRRESIRAALTQADEWLAIESTLRAIERDIRQYGGADDGTLKPDFGPLEHRLRRLYFGLWKSTEAGAAKAKSADVQKLRDDVDTVIAALPELAKEAAERMEDVGAAPAPAPAGADTRDGGGPIVARRARGGIFNRIRISLDGFLGVGDLQVELPTLRSLLRRAWDRVNARVDENIGWDALGILVVGLAIAVGSGLSSEYAGKVIGGPWDYVKLFLWGFATNLLVTTFAKGLDAIGVLRAARQ